MKTVKFNITGMSCSSCQAHITEAVRKMDGVCSVTVNLLSNIMIVEIEENKINNEDIIKVVTDIGYGIYLDKENGSNFRNEWKKRQDLTEKSEENMGKRLLFSVIFFVPLLYITMGHMLNIYIPDIINPHKNPLISAFTQMLITTIIIIINRKFFISGTKSLFKRIPNMDSLVSIGAGASYLYGIIAIYIMMYSLQTGNIELFNNYSSSIYFESAAGILTFITVGKYLETRSKSKTSEALQKLIDLTPKTAIVIKNGEERVIPAENVEKGDIVVIKSGQTIPVDGIIIEGSAGINQSLVTGESISVEKTKGDNVICATINENGYIKIRALNVGEDTTLAKIIKLVDEAGNSKAPAANLADKVSAVFVPIVIGISILTFIIWIMLGQSIEFALNCAISVLVISCPCALGLATPVAITVGIGKAAQYGILIKSAAGLENLSDVNTIVLDKTGTITEGKPKVTDIDILIENMSRSEFLSYAASIESGSYHPVSEAVINKAKSENIDTVKLDKFENYPGGGVSALIGQSTFFAGNYEFINKNNIQFENIQEIEELLEKYSKEGKTPLIFAKDDIAIGLIAVADKIKKTSTDAVICFQKMGIKVVLLTGDNNKTAKAVAEELNIDEVFSDVMPAEKENIIRKLQNSGHKVAMVGDGINDAPALTRADIGIAIGAGSDIAIDSADIILMKNSLNDVVTAIELSKSVVKNIKTNLFWAFFYNIIGIPLAAGVLYPVYKILLSPIIAAFAMSFSSVCVVINALSLKLFKSKTNESFQEDNIQKGEKQMKKIISIKGMACSHCQEKVQSAIEKIDGVLKVNINLETKIAEVICSKEIDDKIFINEISKAGYEANMCE